MHSRVWLCAHPNAPRAAAGADWRVNDRLAATGAVRALAAFLCAEDPRVVRLAARALGRAGWNGPGEAPCVR